MTGFWIGLGVVVLVAIVAVMRRGPKAADAGPVAIALLRTKKRNLTEADVRGAVRRSLGVEAEVKLLPFDKRTHCFAVMTQELPPLGVIDSGRTYIEPEDLEEMAAGCEDPRLRHAMLSHKAWVSVDAMGLDRLPKREQRANIYQNLLGKLAAQFVDDDTLVVYAPAEKRFGPVTPQTPELLATSGLADILNDDDLNVPIIKVEDDDAKINAAMETARKRLPEFIAAVERLGPKAEALIKAAFADDQGKGEHMWAKVTSITGGVITAEIVNRPANPKLPAKGASVTIDPDHVSDWAYLDERGKPQGMFVERLLHK